MALLSLGAALSTSFPIESCNNMCIQLLDMFYHGRETVKL